MKYYQDALAARAVTFVVAWIAFLTVLAAPLMAQRDSGRQISPSERAARQTARLNQQMQLRGLIDEKDKALPDNSAYLRVVVEQAKQDFDRIQRVNYELMRAVSAGNNEFNYKNITEMTSEIRKRAKRFKDNINLPPPDESQANARKLDQINQAEMKGALLMLGERIMSFVMNPLFQTSNLMDIKLGAKASSDLAVIIELSGTIRKNAERLAKSQK
ncbi:MAG TPA: hypothetical protein VF766_03800 [Pyrinomonadaceae bacterium]